MTVTYENSVTPKIGNVCHDVTDKSKHGRLVGLRKDVAVLFDESTKTTIFVTRANVRMGAGTGGKPPRYCDVPKSQRPPLPERVADLQTKGMPKPAAFYAVLHVDDLEIAYEGENLDLAADALIPGTVYGVSGISQMEAHKNAAASAAKMRKGKK